MFSYSVACTPKKTPQNVPGEQERDLFNIEKYHTFGLASWHLSYKPSPSYTTLASDRQHVHIFIQHQLGHKMHQSNQEPLVKPTSDWPKLDATSPTTLTKPRSTWPYHKISYHCTTLWKHDFVAHSCKLHDLKYCHKMFFGLTPMAFDSDTYSALFQHGKS